MQKEETKNNAVQPEGAALRICIYTICVYEHIRVIIRRKQNKNAERGPRGGGGPRERGPSFLLFFAQRFAETSPEMPERAGDDARGSKI